jgi:rsbT co-antagonist protein RsbR
MTTDSMPESTLQAQTTRLRQFLSAYMPTAFLFGIVFLVLALVFRDLATGVSGAAVALNGAILLYALRNVRQGKVQSAIVTTSVGLLMGGLIILLVQPFFFATLTLTPLLVIVLGLQYLTLQPLKRLIAASGACSLIAIIVGHLLPQGVLSSNLPEWFRETLQIGAAAATVVFVMVLLWHFSVLLNDMLASLRSANREMEIQQTRLVRANEQLQQQLASERELLNLVSALETPVVSLAEGILLAPIVGHIDSRRADTSASAFVGGCPQQSHQTHDPGYYRCHHYRHVGGAGADDDDSGAALARLQRDHQRHLGNVALTLTHLGIDMSNVETVRSPEEALQRLRTGERLAHLPVVTNGLKVEG